MAFDNRNLEDMNNSNSGDDASRGLFGSLKSVFENLSRNDDRLNDQIDEALKAADGNSTVQEELVDKSMNRTSERERFFLKCVAGGAVLYLVKRVFDS